MHVHFLDPYRAGASPVHRADARVKLVLTLAFIITMALLPVGAWPVYALAWFSVLAVIILSGLGVRFVLGKAALALPFVMAALPLLFRAPGPALLSFQIGPWVIAVQQAGLERFLSIALKSWISVQAAILLATSTPFPELLVAMRAIRLPRLLVAVFSLMWRYLFIFVDEVLRMTRARQARSGQSDRPDLKTGGSVVWRARVTGNMAGSLFIRAFERSDRIYAAMLARGYDGEVRSAPLSPLSKASWLALAAGLLILMMFLTLSIFYS